jgi:HEPN domain-containing protein
MQNREIEARRWFRQAQADLAVVKTLRSAGHYAAACFHAQQAGEKALKAVLFSQGSRIVWGHSVRELGRDCEPLDTAFTKITAQATLLDQFYIPTRYPNGLPSPAVPGESYTENQAEMAQVAATAVLTVAATFLLARTDVLS